MLTSSPAAPRASTSASPRPSTFTYDYASSTARSPHHSPRDPSRVITPLPTRRLSKPSSSHSHSVSSPSSARGPRPSASPSPSVAANPPPGRPKQYVSVDAGTQYSPMEPFDPTVPLRAGDPSEAGPRRSSALPPSHAHSRAAADSSGSVASGSQSAVGEPPQEPNIAANKLDNSNTVTPLSPSKRRKSAEPTLPHVSLSSVVASSQPSSPKRSRPNHGPSKPLPLKYEFCDVEDMVVLIANMLSELIETNDSIAMKSGQLTRFHSRTAPGISVLDYLNRLAKHATLTPPLLLSMVYYIDRLCALYTDFTINTLTVHRFLITAAAVAGKGLSDSFWNNSFYARVGGVKVAELKLLELEFLYRVDWKIIPNPEVLVAYYKGLVERCDKYTLEGDDDEVGDDSDEIDSDLSTRGGDSEQSGTEEKAT